MEELTLVLPEEMAENERLVDFIQTVNQLLVIAYNKGFDAGKNDGYFEC